MKDAQQQNIIALESEMWNATVAHQVPLRKLRHLIEAMARYWKVTPPRVCPLPGRPAHIADCGNGVIRMGKHCGGRTAWTAAHEAAHHVCDEKYVLLGDEIEAHGPEWATIFILTLDIFHILPLAASIPMFRAHRIDFNRDTIEAYRKGGKRASTRLRANLIRKTRQIQWPNVGSVFAQGRIRLDRRRVQTDILVWVY